MPNRALEEIIGGLSPGALSIFKKQLREKYPIGRNTAVEQLRRSMPELFVPEAQPAPQRQEAPQEMPWWQHPLQWLRGVETGFGAAVTAPFTPAVPGTEQLPWFERERAEYEAWEEPGFKTQPLFRLPWTPEEMREEPWTIGVKGAVETLPWFATALATMGTGALAGIGARTGITALTRAAAIGTRVLRPALAVERALTYPIAKPLSIAAKKIMPKIAGAATRLIADLQPIDEAIGIATNPTKLRNLVNVSIGGKQPLKGIAEMVGGMAATADNPAKIALVGRNVLRFEGANKATAAIATLNRMGTSKKIFNLGDDLLIRSGPLKGKHIETLRTYPKKYVKHLTEEQNAWLQQSSRLEVEKKALFDRAGIEIKELTFEEGGEYAGRRVFAKFTSDGELIDVAYIGRGQPGRPGAKTAAEKTRVFESPEEATALGYRYLPPEEGLFYNITGAYNRVADKQFGDWFLTQVPHRTVAVAGMTGAANAERKEVVAALKQINNIALRLKNKEPIPGQLLKGIKAYYPDEYNQVRLLVKQGFKQSDVDDLLRFVRREQLWHKREWAETQRWFRDARKQAVRPTLGETMAPDIPAFAGKVFTSPEAKEYINIIRKELNPGFNSALHAINQVNAVGRYFALAGDVSPFGIQLIFLAGAHPKIYGKAMKGFVRAMFDPLYHDNFLAKHIATIQSHPNLILTRGGATEFTEAMAKGGLLRKGPLKIGGKVLEPFQRGFEASLDTAGIYMAEAYGHLGTTAARVAQVDAFINEFRGLLNTTRIGISSTGRQLERALVLAPQYNRAIGALMWDFVLGLVGKGGLRGKLARDAMAKGTAAIMAMTVAVSYAMGESEDEIVEHLNPLSPNFMTWDIAGQRVGPGSKVRSLLYVFGKIAQNPEDTGYYAGRFMRGNFAPVIGTSMDLITGKDYIGDPTRDGLPSLTKTVLGENLLPIWVQSVAFEGGDLSGRVTRALAEFGGARGYPAGAYGELRALQDELAQTKYGMSWEELGMRPDGMALQMRITRESPELQELSKTAAEESQRWAHGEQLVWNEYGMKVDRIGSMVTQELNQAAQQFEATGNGSQLRERVNQAYWLKAQMMDDLLKQDEFALVKEQFEKPLTEEQRAGMQPQKLLYRDYNELMYAPDLFDQFGEYRFDEADRRRQLFIQQYGIEALNSVEMVIGERRADEPAAVKMLRQARVILKPYWDIEKQIWANYSPELKQISDQILILERTDPRQAKQILFQYPAILMARRLVALYRKQFKMQRPEIANALNVFYRY